MQAVCRIEGADVKRSLDEIQKAHDMVVAIILGDVTMPLGEMERFALMESAGVLCWLLGHDHNEAFATNLHNIEAWMKANCIEQDMGSPVSREGRTQ